MTSSITTHHQQSIDLCSDLCHDDMHVDGDSCPNCNGWLAGCTDCTPDHIKAKRHAEKIRTRQTPSIAQAKTTLPQTPAATTPHAAGRPAGEALPTRRPVNPHDRVTSTTPFAVEQEVGDDDWTVTVHLTDDAARQLARDLTRRHMADLVLLARLNAQGGKSLAGRADALEVESRLAGALQSMATTQWVLTPLQAERLLDDLEDANAEPNICAVGTCSAYAIDGGSYCAPHTDGM